jgi:patatin-like phospholipase/acyl hydrolase
VLALDGGGVRGAITVAFLERIEHLLSQHCGRTVRLGDYFHLVGGTSTGSIIAGAIALGFSAAQVKELYTTLAPLAFVRKRTAIPILQAKFDVSGITRRDREDRRRSRAAERPADHRHVRGDQAYRHR